METGFKDMYGREIWLGDTLRYKDSDWFHKRKVILGEKGFCLEKIGYHREVKYSLTEKQAGKLARITPDQKLPFPTP